MIAPRFTEIYFLNPTLLLYITLLLFLLFLLLGMENEQFKGLKKVVGRLGHAD